MKKLFIGLLILIITSCTKNKLTRNFGSTQTIKLEHGKRLVNITWKETNMWLLIKYDTNKPSTYEFKEYSNWNLVQGKVIIQEQ